VALAGYYDSAADQAAIAYRSNTGSSTINSPKTRTWDGSTWSAEAEQANANNPIRVVRMAWSPTDANTRIIVTESDDGFLDAYVYSVGKLASKRGSNQIGLIGGDLTNTRVNAWIWDGTAWGNFVAIATTNVGPVDRDNADLAWESGSGNLLAVAASNSASIVSKEYTTSWGSAATFACASGA